MAGKTLLFDLGGVLVRNSMFEDLPRLSPRFQNAADPHGMWLSSPIVRAFEKGEMDADAFADGFIAEYELGVSRESFLTGVAGWLQGFYPGVPELLAELRGRHRIAYLSNSNAIHWAAAGEILAHADVTFSSHLCGLVKPDPEIFLYVLDQLGAAPDEVCFFDDAEANVATARTLGIEAHRTVGFEAVRAVVAARGF